MTSIEEAATVPGTRDRVLRTAGVAGIAYAVTYGMYFATNQIRHAMDPSLGEEYVTAEQLSAQLPTAAILAMIFAFNATAGLVALSSLAVFVRRSGSELAGALTALAGAFFIGIAGAAYSGVVMSSFLTEYIPGSGATPEAQSAVIQGLYALPQTFSGLAATAFAAWQIIAALSRAFPRWITIVNLVLASLSLGTYFIGFSVGIILVIPYLLAVGIWALRRSRRA